MNIILANTFASSLTKLTADEQKAAKTTALDLQLNPELPGLRLHRVEKVADAGFWSARVTDGLRLILHRTNDSMMLCHVGTHDSAYRWAERRRIEAHPVTGVVQIVEIRERVQEIVVPRYVDVETAKPVKRPFAKYSPAEVLAWGVPQDWVEEVRQVAEDDILDLGNHLPHEAVELLVDIAFGKQPAPAHPPVKPDDPFEHPDAQRRFRLIATSEALQEALEATWDQWVIYLHPDQRSLVTKDFNGPARVSGSAGTGKTIVALHRAVHLARSNPGARVLLTTFSDALAGSLKDKLQRLAAGEPKLLERLEVLSVKAVGRRLWRANGEQDHLVTQEELEQELGKAAKVVPGHKFTLPFLRSEWEEVVEGWNLATWEGYREVPRLGRKVRLPEALRKTLWSIFSLVLESLESRGLTTEGGLFNKLEPKLLGRTEPPFDFVVVDEAQDLSRPQLRFFAAFGAEATNRLFFAGDLAQRIFRSPFSWKAAGIDLRGRSRTLRVNYRTSQQIRKHADRLLATDVSDVDGLAEKRNTTISVFNGPEPKVLTLSSPEEETLAVVGWLKELLAQGIKPYEIALVVRSPEQFPRAHAASLQAQLPFVVLDETSKPKVGSICLATMHFVKGLEFRAVAILACDFEVLPSPERLEAVADESELEEVFNTERNLLYVACTRARDYLLLTAAGEPSEFLADLQPAPQ